MSHNAPTQTRETPAEKTARLATCAKAEIDRLVTEAAEDATFYGKPTIELSIQGGKLETISVNKHRTHK